jgi:hypothetical protein
VDPCTPHQHAEVDLIGLASGFVGDLDAYVVGAVCRALAVVFDLGYSSGGAHIDLALQVSGVRR